MRKYIAGLTLTLFLIASGFSAPEVSFSGYLDADVWGDLNGNYFANSELDLGMTMKFTEKVSTHLYVTMLSAYAPSGLGSIPAGVGQPSERWVSVNFDGFDLTYESQIGTFSIGDLVYQYGQFNYYFYKRLSMITPESFTRGIKYGISNDWLNQEILIGVTDLDGNSADVQGLTGINFGKEQSLSLYYGLRGSSLERFSEGTNFFAGAEFLGSFNENVTVKADIGYSNLAGVERKNVVSLLLEPTLTIGKFSTAFTGYALFDPDSANELQTAPLFNLPDELLFYIEPAYSFNEVFAAGLPLEFHGADMENKNDNAFWVVPTIYIFPAENVQWWLWGQLAIPLVDGVTSKEFSYGIGSEIIVEF